MSCSQLPFFYMSPFDLISRTKSRPPRHSHHFSTTFKMRFALLFAPILSTTLSLASTLIPRTRPSAPTTSSIPTAAMNPDPSDGDFTFHGDCPSPAETASRCNRVPQNLPSTCGWPPYRKEFMTECKTHLPGDDYTDAYCCTELLKKSCDRKVLVDTEFGNLSPKAQGPKGKREVKPEVMMKIDVKPKPKVDFSKRTSIRVDSQVEVVLFRRMPVRGHTKRRSSLWVRCWFSLFLVVY